MNMATLTTYPTGTAVSTYFYDLRLRDGKYIEADVTAGEAADFDLTIMHFGFLPVNEQYVR